MVMPWLFAVLLVVALAAVVAAVVDGPWSGMWRRHRRRGTGRGRTARQRDVTGSRPVRRVANAAPLLASPAVRRRIALRRLLHATLGACVVVALFGASTVAGRPVETTVRNEALASRDIVLCLDVSTSMVTIDSKILETFSELLDTFDGERVALVAWNTTAQTIVPLMDDYEMLDAELNRISEVLDFDPYYGNPAVADYYNAFTGTLLESVDASSLIGDGLASCTLVFDHPTEDRSRSIILASDNMVMDPYDLQIYPLSEAADLAAEEDIRLFSLFGADPEFADSTVAEIDRARDELKQVTLEHDGLFYEVDDADTAGAIVEELESEQIDELEGNTQARRTDVPYRPAAVLGLAVLVLLSLSAWRRA